MLATLYIETDYRIDENDGILSILVCFFVLVVSSWIAWKTFKYKLERKNREVSIFNKIYNELVEADPEFD